MLTRRMDHNRAEAALLARYGVDMTFPAALPLPSASVAA